jgi:hypothetical protein
VREYMYKKWENTCIKSERMHVYEEWENTCIWRMRESLFHIHVFSHSLYTCILSLFIYMYYVNLYIHVFSHSSYTCILSLFIYMYSFTLYTCILSLFIRDRIHAYERVREYMYMKSERIHVYVQWDNTCIWLIIQRVSELVLSNAKWEILQVFPRVNKVNVV